MFLGYNTNGLAHHDLFDAVELLAEIGYHGVAITIDHNALPPPDNKRRDAASTERQISRIRALLDRLGMRSVIETGARFLLDPRNKHEPTLLSRDPRRRIEFYNYAVDCAAALGSDCVSLWSGTYRPFGEPKSSANRSKTGNMDLPPCESEQAMDRLVAGLREVTDYAAERAVTIAFEPEPGMLIDSTRAFETLLTRFDAANFALTLDIGHLHCQGETPIAEVIRRWAPRLANVHIEDTRQGIHEHLMFGEGEIDFPPVNKALSEVGYAGGAYVELSRHSHEGVAAAQRAYEFLVQADGR